jgi:hypothetical protein
MVGEVKLEETLMVVGVGNHAHKTRGIVQTEDHHQYKKKKLELAPEEKRLTVRLTNGPLHHH